MHWSFSPDVPIYLQIMEQLEQMIVSGVLSPGDRLMSVREFAADANVNPNTMQKALTELEKRGIVYSQRTSGRFITDNPEKLRELREELAQKEIAGFLESMKRLGYTDEEALELLSRQIRTYVQVTKESIYE
ncbi:MAG: GntR family transcriptional regulator [Oscillospiraceae bacterium]|nr:GntR family transcriptional regulator [Oscillospiraceae bacterium]